MNIVTPIPTNIPVNPVNAGVEPLRRENQLRDTIQNPHQGEASARGKGSGSESESARTVGLPPVNSPVYEKPQVNSQLAQQAISGQPDKDNGKDESAGKERAEDEQKQQARQQAAEEKQIDELTERDREVRAHEQAHANTGGQYAGAPSYEYQTGPDGKQYAIGGEVSIDISEVHNDPEATIRKMQQVQRAAMAPSEPSATDLRVAAEASQKANEARADLAAERAEKASQNFKNTFSDEQPKVQQGPKLEDIVVPGGGITSRSLSSDPVASASGAEVSLESESDPVAQAAGAEVSLATEAKPVSQSVEMQMRAARIQQRYQNSFVPLEQQLSIFS